MGAPRRTAGRLVPHLSSPYPEPDSFFAARPASSFQGCRRWVHHLFSTTSVVISTVRTCCNKRRPASLLGHAWTSRTAMALCLTRHPTWSGNLSHARLHLPHPTAPNCTAKLGYAARGVPVASQHGIAWYVALALALLPRGITVIASPSVPLHSDAAGRAAPHGWRSRHPRRRGRKLRRGCSGALPAGHAPWGCASPSPQSSLEQAPRARPQQQAPCLAPPPAVSLPVAAVCAAWANLGRHTCWGPQVRRRGSATGRLWYCWFSRGGWELEQVEGGGVPAGPTRGNQVRDPRYQSADTGAFEWRAAAARRWAAAATLPRGRSLPVTKGSVRGLFKTMQEAMAQKTQGKDTDVEGCPEKPWCRAGAGRLLRPRTGAPPRGPRMQAQMQRGAPAQSGARWVQRRDAAGGCKTIIWFLVHEPKAV